MAGGSWTRARMGCDGVQVDGACDWGDELARSTRARIGRDGANEADAVGEDEEGPWDEPSTLRRASGGRDTVRVGISCALSTKRGPGRTVVVRRGSRVERRDEVGRGPRRARSMRVRSGLLQASLEVERVCWSCSAVGGSAVSRRWSVTTTNEAARLAALGSNTKSQQPRA